MNANLFERYAKYIWPLHRRALTLPKRCGKCILLINEEKELCPECEQYSLGLGMKQNPKGNYGDPPPHTETDEEFVLLLSGGKDSAVLLDKFRRDYPSARVQALLVNTGFMSPAAIKNAMIVSGRTNTDLVIMNELIPEFKERLSTAFRSLKGGGKGAYGVVDFAEGRLIYEAGFRFAGKKRIISGLTHAQLDHIETGKTENMLFPLVWWGMSETEIRRTAARVLGVKEVNPLQTNSLLIPVMMTADMLNLGYSSFEPEFAQLIREGKADRTTWLHQFELFKWLAEQGYLEKTFRDSLQQLNLRPEDVLCMPM